MTVGPSYYGDDDYDDPREARDYCKHGTYIGNWAGPDYMCGMCEDGVSDEEWAAIMAARAATLEAEQGERMFWDALANMCRSERVALGLTPHGGPLSDVDGDWSAFMMWIIDARKATS